jgi:hypothetical protein
LPDAAGLSRWTVLLSREMHLVTVKEGEKRERKREKKKEKGKLLENGKQQVLEK